MPTPTAAPPWHPPNELPDSDITILVRFSDQDDHEPIWPGFHDGTVFRGADGSRFSCGPIGWMHLEDAACILDAAKP